MERGRNALRDARGSILKCNISHFFAVHPVLPYHGLEHHFYMSDVKNYKRLDDRYWWRRPPEEYGMPVDIFIERLLASHTPDMTTFSGWMEGTAGQNIIFSNNVLSDPGMKRDMKFWHLPGIHFHYLGYHDLKVRWTQRYKGEGRLSWPEPAKELNGRIAAGTGAYSEILSETYDVTSRITQYPTPFYSAYFAWTIGPEC